MRNPLVIRADANVKMGTGHLMRCLALSQAWKDSGGEVIFITACSNEQLLQCLYDEKFIVRQLEHSHPDPHDWEETKRFLDKYQRAWLILDGYHFDSDYQRKVKETGHKLLVIDDMAHLPHYYADIILNQNLHAKNLQYSCEPYTKLLLGTKYVILRQEFLKWKGWKRKIPESAKKILVTLGGSDPRNITLKIIHALQQVNIPDLEVTVIIGACNPHADTLKEAIRQSRFFIRLLRNVKNMPELMAWADLAVSSAGITVWELAFMGVPTIVGVTAPIEEFLVDGLEKYGLFINVGWFDRLDVEQLAKILRELIQNEAARRNMTMLSQHLIDGAGRSRVLEHLSIKKDKKRMTNGNFSYH